MESAHVGAIGKVAFGTSAALMLLASIIAFAISITTCIPLADAVQEGIDSRLTTTGISDKACQKNVTLYTQANKAKNATGKANKRTLFSYTVGEGKMSVTKTLSCFDVTGDKMPDKLRLVALGNDSDMELNADSLRIYVNGKCVDDIGKYARAVAHV